MKKFALLFLFMLTASSLQGITLGELKRPYVDRVYIDEDEFSIKGGESDAFYIHVGNNQWISTRSIHRDERGLFTYESQVFRAGINDHYEKKWRCPYCYQFWPMKTPCQNPDCPSTF